MAPLDDLRAGRIQESRRKQAGRLCESPEFADAEADRLWQVAVRSASKLDVAYGQRDERLYEMLAAVHRLHAELGLRWDSYLRSKGVKRAPQARSPFQPVARFLLGTTRYAETAKATSYAAVLDEAVEQGIAPDRIITWLRNNGGVDKIYRARVARLKPPPTPKSEREQLVRDWLSQPPIAVIELPGGHPEIAGCDGLFVAVIQVHGQKIALRDVLPDFDQDWIFREAEKRMRERPAPRPPEPPILEPIEVELPKPVVHTHRPIAKVAIENYPGTHRGLEDRIVKTLRAVAKRTGIDSAEAEYREPFAGGGAIGIKFLAENRQFERAWFNDLDPAVYCAWECSLRDPAYLDLVRSYQPRQDDFFCFREKLTTLRAVPRDITARRNIALAKLALHKISHGGLGEKSGGPEGGKSQEKLKIDRRWDAEKVRNRLLSLREQIEHILPRLRLTNFDFAKLIEEDGSAILYVDPPFYTKGEQFYSYSFMPSDHERLASLLRATTKPWVASYDDDEAGAVRGLFGWAHIQAVPMRYPRSRGRVQNELIIVPHRSLAADLSGI
jgi:DNA adenine methylase